MDEQHTDGLNTTPTQHSETGQDQVTPGGEALSDQDLDAVSGGLNAISESADTGGGWSPPSQNNWGLAKPPTRKK